MKSGKKVLISIICLLILCDVSFCRRLGEAILDKAPPNGMVQMRKSLEHPKQSSDNKYDTIHSIGDPDEYQLNEKAENSIKEKDEDNKVHKKKSDSQENGGSINRVDERKDNAFNSDKNDKKSEEIVEKEEKKDYADDHNSKSGEIKDSNNPGNELSDKPNMDNDRDNEHKLKHNTIDDQNKHENGMSDPNVFNRKLNGHENPEKEDVKTKANENDIHNTINGTGNIITDGKSDKKDDSRKSNSYDKSYKKYSKQELRDSKSHIKISDPDAREHSKDGMDVSDYVKDLNANQYLRDNKGPHNNQNKYGKTEHQEDTLTNGKNSINAVNRNTISSENKYNIGDQSVSGKGQFDHEKPHYNTEDTQRNGGQTRVSVNNDISEGAGVQNQVNSREYIKNDKAKENSKGALAAKVGHADNKTTTASSQTLESPTSTGTDKVEIGTHQTETFESESEEIGKKQEKGDKIPKELDNSVINHSSDTAKPENTKKLDITNDGTLTAAIMTITSLPASMTTQTKIISKETSTMKTGVLPHTTTILRFQTESVTKTQGPATGKHRTTNVPNKVPDLNPIDEYICNGGYSRAAVVSGTVGGMFLGGGLVFLFFYCKRRCSKYIKGDYRPVPMEYDFELNPRYKNT